MANVHNMFIRMLNSIYLQCEHVHDPQDVLDFLFYCSRWSKTLHHHHHAEEEELFPKLEELIGRPGSLETNIRQHDAFQKGLEDFATYTQHCEEEGPKAYDGKKMKILIDSFGKDFETHMHDEINTLLDVKKHDPDGDKSTQVFLKFEGKVLATLDKVSKPFVWNEKL